MIILLDFHRNISSAQCFFKCTSDSICNIEIIVEPSNLCVSLSKNSTFHKLNILMPENFLLPSTITSMYRKTGENYSAKHRNDAVILNFPVSSSNFQIMEFGFRLQIKNESLTKNEDLRESFKDFMYDKFKSVKTFRIVCTTCCETLTEKDINFHSIFKYIEGMSDMVENWFCHKHDHDKCCDNDYSEASSNSLYISNIYFYFHTSILKTFHLSENNRDYRCEKCASILSLKKKMDNPQYIGFFSDKIMLTESETDIESYKMSSTIFSFCSIIDELLLSGITCKIYLQSKVSLFVPILFLKEDFFSFLFIILNQNWW